MRLSDLSERELLARLTRRVGGMAKGVALGIGDDAALLTALGPQAVLTADLLIEGVDFERAWARGSDIGHKAAAQNLSDLAGMGAEPRGVLLSLGVTPQAEVRDVLALVAAVDTVGRRYGAPLVGGDLSRTSGPMVVAVTAVGQVRSNEALRRYRGRPGDIVLVSGTLGGAALGLRCLMKRVPRERAFKARQLTPTPRVELGRALARRKLVKSAADISDGLAADALHIAAPGVGVRLFADALPLPRGAERLAARLGTSAVEAALSGGEDFELVLAVAPEKVAAAERVGRQAGVPLTRVGELVRGRGVEVVGAPRGTTLSGFDHFRRRGRRVV